MTDAADLARQLADAADAVPKQLEPVVLRGALDIKDDARARLRRSSDRRGEFAANLISADGDGLTAEVGYTYRDYEPVCRALEFGTSHTAPVGALGGAADGEVADFADAVEKVVARAWR